MNKRRRILAILVLPVLALIFMLGWILAWIGENAEEKQNGNVESIP